MTKEDHLAHETPGEHGHTEVWHRHTAEEGVPQVEHGGQASPKVLALTLLAMVFGVAFTIIVLIMYFNFYTSRLTAERIEGISHVKNEVIGARNEANARLNSVGVIDRDAGTIHIPVDRAAQFVIDEYADVAAETGGNGS